MMGFWGPFRSKGTVFAGPEFLVLFYAFQDRGFNGFAEKILKL